MDYTAIILYLPINSKKYVADKKSYKKQRIRS